MNLLAYRTLFRERVRLVVTLAGIAFAVVLVMLQLGLRVTAFVANPESLHCP